METMWAIRKPAPEPGLVLDEVQVPAPGDGEVLVAVEAASVCGTDLHIFRWDQWSQSRIRPPVTLGHELAGTIVELGPNVRHA
jgi:threonine 3-dehydrogenase